MKMFGLVAASLAAMIVPSQAQAVVTTFANFAAAKGTDYNFSYNSATKTLYSTTNANPLATPASYGTLGAATVNFNFLQGSAASSTGIIPAGFTFSATTSSNASYDTNTGVVSEGGFNGNFSFVALKSFTSGGTTYAAGTSLLTGSFTNALVSASLGSTAGGVTDSTQNLFTVSSITYSSPFVSVANSADRSLSFSLDAITPSAAYNATTKDFNSFAANVGGQFSSSVPEASTWAMMLAGFGLIGFASRRNRALVAA